MGEEPEYPMAEMRKAASICDRLRRHGKPIPEDVRKKSSAYQRARRRIRDPEVGTRKCGRRRKYGMPEEIRESNRRYEQCKRDGAPIPDDAAEGQREYRRQLRVANGIKPLKPLRIDIPDKWRESASTYHRLHRREESVPEDVMKGISSYNRQCANEEFKTGRLPIRDDVPDRLRAANTEYHRRLRKKQPIPEELRVKVRLYAKALYRRAPGKGRR